jgi:transcriptional regulator
MYINRDHALTDLDAMHALMDAHPLGAWVLRGDTGLVANHIPFLLDRSQGPHGTLIGHVARANPAWRMLAAQTPSLVIFQGPDSYITPNWYPGKADQGKVVPTWDYSVVHAHGVARAVEDPAWLLYMLERLTNRHEAVQPVPWKVKDAPRAYINKLLRAIVGVEIRIERLEGKLKASQDEAREDRLGTVAGLRSLRDPKADAMADLVNGALDA